jgi:hypothetical protein
MDETVGHIPLKQKTQTPEHLLFLKIPIVFQQLPNPLRQPFIVCRFYEPPIGADNIVAVHRSAKATFTPRDAKTPAVNQSKYFAIPRRARRKFPMPPEK